MTHARPKTPDRDLHGLRDLAGDFKLLADLTRLRIIAYLIREGEVNVSDLCTHLGQTQPAVSHHLSLLRVSGFVDVERRYKFVYYHIVPERFAGLRDFLPMVLATAMADAPAKTRRTAKQALRARRATPASQPPTAEQIGGVEGFDVGAGERSDEASVVTPTANGDMAAGNGEAGVEETVLAAG